ncbi:unnamed protein product [Soboliphyme baturini]|uniref:Vps5 domain-containing protein n=1 Tax=Soboliphyme baturini TaxID=241478 RepID=A0A183J631_9BILA|nr:unnamed protein product [Soboliphyme baturini]
MSSDAKRQRAVCESTLQKFTAVMTVKLELLCAQTQTLKNLTETADDATVAREHDKTLTTVQQLHSDIEHVKRFAELQNESNSVMFERCFESLLEQVRDSVLICYQAYNSLKVSRNHRTSP